MKMDRYGRERVHLWAGTQVFGVTGKSLLLDKGEYEDKQVCLFPVGSVCTYPTDERKFNCVMPKREKY